VPALADKALTNGALAELSVLRAELPSHLVAGSSRSIRILGPVSLVVGEEEVPIGGTLPRGFLGLLALESPRPVSVDRIASMLWGESPPNGIKAAVQQLASRVRRALAVAGLGDALRSVPPGYALNLEADSIDVRVFRAHHRQGTDAIRLGDHEVACAELDAALGLWHGAAFADLVDLPIATFLAPGLDDERWRAEEARSQSLLSLGQAGRAAHLLASATTAAPFRERLWQLRATALAADGRPTEAVQCIRTGIAVISAELGVSPGRELMTLEQSLSVRASPMVQASARNAPRVDDDLMTDALRRALDNAETGARSATERHAYGDAVRLLQRALELLDAVDPENDQLRLRLLLQLGDAHNTASLATEAWNVFEEATELARQLGDARGFGRAVLGFCADRTTLTSDRPATLLRQALDMLGDDDTGLRGRLLSRLSTEEYWMGSIARSRELAEEGLAEVTRAGDVEGVLLAHYSRAFSRWTPLDGEELLGVCEEYLAAAEASHSSRHTLLAHRWLVTACCEAGDLQRAGREAEAALRLADETGMPTQQWMSKVIAATHSLLVGDLECAEGLATEGLALGSVAEPETALDYVSIFIWTTRWLQGRLAEVASLVDAAAAQPGADIVRRMGLALTHGELGRLDAARAVLDTVTEAEIDSIPMNTTWFIALAAMAEAAASTDHAPAARIAHQRLSPYPDRIALTSVTSTGPIAHHIGISAWVLGYHDEAVAHLHHAVEHAERMGAKVFAARSRAALADRLRAMADPGEAPTSNDP
jgi:DNA-binding SARP family transcriptional activator